MFNSIGLRDLAELCRRLSISLEAGLDVRRTLEREAAGRASPALRRRLQELADMTAAGRTISEGLERTGNFFPPLFREMVELGEETGKLGEVLRQLSEHYEHQLLVRRTFLASITWPMLQLTAAVCVIGLVIWIMGMVSSFHGGEAVDILGFGLVGNQGLVIYFLFLLAVVAGAFAIYQAFRRGYAALAPLQTAILRIPMVGGALMTLALARLAWTLQLTLGAGMDLKRAIPLSLRSSRTLHFSQHGEAIVMDISRGHEIHEALANSGAFPNDFLEHLQVGEHSGRLPESMEILSRQYQDEANRAIATLAMVAGFAVWAMVALLIIAIILRIAMFIGGVYNEALSW